TSYTSSSLILNWRDVSGETGYRIERSVDGTNWTQITTVGQNIPSYTNTGLSTATTYYYRLTSLSTAGDGPIGAAMSRSTRLAVVSGFSVTGTTTTSITLSWTTLAGATGYRILRSTDGTNYGVVTTTANVTTYTDTSLVAGTEYYYHVIGVNASSE